MWLLHLLVSFFVTLVLVGSVLCSGLVPYLLSFVSKKRSKKLHTVIQRSTPVM